MDDTVERDDSYVPAHLAIEAMRDNGYKNTAYAIAELIDNAIQARATAVELLCAEKEVRLAQRSRMRVEQIAVLDNGDGMDAEVLRIALQFGNGTRLESGKVSGIGRFGMGLPASSVSQCQRVDVWSWQHGLDSAVHTHLDVNEVRKGRRSTVPEPVVTAVPEVWRTAGKTFGETGTLVVWTQLDRLMWQSARAIIENSERLIGRIYRKFLDGDRVTIRLAAFNVEEPEKAVEHMAHPNDPLYLMDHTSCPPPFHETAMFRPWGGDDNEATYTVDFQGAHHEVRLRFSYAKEEARPDDTAGSRPHGQHAKTNVGVSIVRAGRELELDQGLVIQYDPVERWWGVEVEFPPGLDELFGVTNNKQTARNFAELARYDIQSVLKEGKKTLHQLKDEWEADGDPRLPLLDIVLKIQTQLRVLREALRLQTKGQRTEGRKRYDAEETATARTRQRQEEGHRGESDAGEALPEEERKEDIAESLVQNGVSESEAQELAARTVKRGLKYTFGEAPIETDAFFSVRPMGGVIVITLNTRHPAYDRLVEVLEKEVEGVEPAELSSRLSLAADGLKLLLTAWARYEDELDGPPRQQAIDARSDWGRMAREFLKPDE